MTKFEVMVNRTLFKSLVIDANTGEEAEQFAREQIDAEFENIQEWDDYEPLKLECYVMTPTDLNPPTE